MRVTEAVTVSGYTLDQIEFFFALSPCEPFWALLAATKRA